MSEVETIKYWVSADIHKTTCSCHSHAAEFHIEYDSECDIVSMSVFDECGIYEPYENKESIFDLVRKFWKRIKIAATILVDGCYTTEGYFIFRGKDQIIELSDCLRESATRLDHYNNKDNNRN